MATIGRPNRFEEIQYLDVTWTSFEIAISRKMKRLILIICKTQRVFLHIKYNTKCVEWFKKGKKKKGKINILKAYCISKELFNSHDMYMVKGE